MAIKAAQYSCWSPIRI